MARPIRAGLADDQRALFQAVRIQSVQRVVPSDAEIARLLGVDRSTVGRWRRGQPMSPEHHERVVGLDAVVELLTAMLEPESISKWLKGFNAHLGNRRPIDILRAGRTSEVIAAIEAEKSGAFA